jgi:hypothetical protein
MHAYKEMEEDPFSGLYENWSDWGRRVVDRAVAAVRELKEKYASL